MPKEQVEIHLRYEGPDVDDGTMSIQDIVPVLQGFSGAYGKLAAVDDPGSTHRLRIAAVRPGSADIVLDVWRTLGENAAPLTAASITVGAAVGIVRKIAGVIRLKRHVKRQPYGERIDATNSIVVTNSENVQITVSLEIFDLFKSGVIDGDLNKIVSPLVEGRIDAAEIEARTPDGTSLRERITAAERQYFAVDSESATTTKPTWLVAKLNSLTKSTNSGYLYLSDGTRVFYRYAGKVPQMLHHLFGTYDGPVRIRCVAHLDESLKIVSVEVYEIERAQPGLFPERLEGSETENG